MDPNWDPSIREPKRETKVDTPSEQETQWLPRQPPMPGAWIAPDERPPMNPPVWQPPPPPYQPTLTRPSQGLAVASLITSLVGLVFGWWCFGPLPGIAAVTMGLLALSQIKKTPDKVTGRPYAVAGIIIGGINIAFYLLVFLWFVLSLSFGYVK